MLRRFTAILFAAGVPLASAAEPAPPPYDVFPETAEGTETYLKQRFPAGTSLEDVRAYLRSQTFECATRKDPELGEAVIKGEYVFCQRVVPYGFLVGKRWQVAITPQRKAVKDIRATFAFVGR